MATVHLPRSLVALFPTPPPRLVELEARNVRQLIEQLDQRWPGIRDRVCVDDTALRQHINLFVDGERASLETATSPASVVHILPAVAGG